MRKLQLGNEGTLNPYLTIFAMDDRGIGGANHEYHGFYPGKDEGVLDPCIKVKFQNGAINGTGVNGFSNEGMLAIVIDRLEGFLDGEFADKYTTAAKDHCLAALNSLAERTAARVGRGVEGKHAK